MQCPGMQAALEAYAQRMIAQHDLEHSFYVMDLGVVVSCSTLLLVRSTMHGASCSRNRGAEPEGQQIGLQESRRFPEAGLVCGGTAQIRLCVSTIWRTACMSWA